MRASAQTKLLILVLSVICISGAVFCTTAFPALASSIDDITAAAEASENPLQSYRDQQTAIREQMEGLENDIETQENMISGLKNDIAALDAELSLVNQQLIAAQQAIDATNAIIDQLDADILDATARLEERMDLLEERLVNVYIYGDIDIMDVVFDTANFDDFITLFDMVEMIVNQDKDLASQIVAEREQIEADKAEQQVYLADLTILEQEYHDQAADIKRLEDEKAAAIDEANMTIVEYEAYYASLNATAEAASEKIRELLASSDSTLSYGGSMMWPLPAAYDVNYVTSDYGWREHPVYGGQRFHSGVDIGASGGTPIFAAADGKIILEEYYGGYGNCIMIDHGSGVVSLYAHQSAFAGFSVGDYVVASDVIGYVGTTGTSTGNHLHFEVRLNGSYVSPWDYLR